MSVHLGSRFLDAATADPADRPTMKPESAYPLRIPRVTCTLVDTPSGPAWEFHLKGLRSYRGGNQQLPVLDYRGCRPVLLVEAP